MNIWLDIRTFSKVVKSLKWIIKSIVIQTKEVQTPDSAAKEVRRTSH